MRHRASPKNGSSMNGRLSPLRNGVHHGSNAGNSNIIFLSLGFLIIVNVSCFLLFVVLFEPEEAIPNLLVHGKSNATIGTRIDTDSRIPKIIIFTHSINLLQDEAAIHNITDEPTKREFIALQANVRNIRAMHPECTIRFLTDEDCRDSIRATHPPDIAKELVSYFDKEDIGMYKADLCRGVALLETGGLYFDVDLGVRMNIYSVLNATTEFATIRVHPQSHYPGNFFQAFIAATPQHEVIRNYVDLFLRYYRGTERTVHDGPIGVQLLKQAFDQTEHRQQQQQYYSDGNHTHLNRTSEIWQEFLYNWDYEHSLLSHVPPPVWGTRRACKFIVVSAPKLPLMVPFYSRIANSRMCPMSKVHETVS